MTTTATALMMFVWPAHDLPNRISRLPGASAASIN